MSLSLSSDLTIINIPPSIFLIIINNLLLSSSPSIFYYFLAVPVHSDTVPRPLRPCAFCSLRRCSSPFIVAPFPFAPAPFLHVPVSSGVPRHYWSLRHGTFPFSLLVAPHYRSCSLCLFAWSLSGLLARSSPFLVPVGTILSVPRVSWRNPLRSSCLLAQSSPFLVPLGTIISVPRAAWHNPLRSSCLLARSFPFLVPPGTILSVPRASRRDPLRSSCR